MMGPPISLGSIREQTRAVLSDLGYQCAAAFGPPLLGDEVLQARSLKQVVDRALAIYAALCVCFEPSKTRPKARSTVGAWVENNGVVNSLTTEEAAIITASDNHGCRRIEPEVEALFALAWAVSKVESLDPQHYVPETLGSLMPNIEKGSSRKVFEDGAAVRPLQQLVQQLDLHYFLHWASREQQRTGRPCGITVEPYVMRERRRALEWILSPSEGWGDISLDT